MAVLINGNGNEAIYAAQDADWYASIFGGTTAITGVGNQFAAEVLDANTIGVSDGVIITKEGRRIQLDVDEIDNFDIPNGGQGETNYYIIGYRLVTGGDSSQTAEEFVELMDSSTATINEETFREGADSVYISLYRIKQEGFTLTIQDALLPTVKSVMQLNEDLNELREEMGTMGLPLLDYANPLHTFDSSHLSYTVPSNVEECYLIANSYNGGYSSLTINGTVIGNGTTGAYNSLSTLGMIRLTAGDVVTMNTVLSSPAHIFGVRSI